MKFYFAPLEGIAGYVYRNAHHAYFDNIDKYFSPFVVPNQNARLKTKELKDVLPENNTGINLVPQIMTNNAKDFIHTAHKFKQLGYEECNLNLGCPSGTVVSKFRGSGFLRKPKELDVFLDEIFAADVMKISVKTRIGFSNPEEFFELIDIYNKYPIEELIIHPRTREDYYKNKPNLEIFKEAIRLSKNPLCYNGDICSVQDYNTFVQAFPDINSIMIGRGLLRNPGLIDDIKNNNKTNLKIMKEFHDKIYEDYKLVLSGGHNVLYKMKELWNFMIPTVTENDNYLKKIRKADRLTEYDKIIADIFGDR